MKMTRQEAVGLTKDQINIYMNSKLMEKIKSHKWLTAILALGIIYLGYVYFFPASDTALITTNTYVVETVGLGPVSNGIQTTGEIVAAQKLNLDVYKQAKRIETVNVVNGGHVEAGSVLLSFDKSDAYVGTQSSKVSVAEAELTLQTEKVGMTDPNTQMRSLESQIAGYKKSIIDNEQNLKDLYRDFLNTDLEVEPHPSQYTQLIGETTPTLTGRYVSDIEGEYVIEIYRSGADSGYSYRVSGLESVTNPVLIGKANNLGNRGLKVAFPTSIGNGDKWIVYVPNNSIATYKETKLDYETAVNDLKKTISDTRVNLANAEQSLTELSRTDSSSYRNLTVEKAAVSLQEARQKLSQSYDVLQEQDIVAPFSGTIDGLTNVVVGATPTRDSNDAISLGTLISDDFLATFSLSAVDVAKVELNQKVLVTITSFPDLPPLEAFVTEISSLPDSTGVAQYEVQALMVLPEDLGIELREGLLADIEIVETEVTDVVRVPKSAIVYENGKPFVNMIDNLSEQQLKEVNRLGIIRDTDKTINTYPVKVEIGLSGSYYVEITSGLEVGALVVTSNDAAADAPAVKQQSFGPGSRDRENTSSNTNTESSANNR